MLPLAQPARATLTARRKQIYEEMHSETRQETPSPKKDDKLSSCTSETAKAMGRIKRSVQRDAERGSKVFAEAMRHRRNGGGHPYVSGPVRPGAHGEPYNAYNLSDPSGDTLTMSSLEIAELCGNCHDQFMRDIRQVLEELAQPKSGVGQPKSGHGEPEDDYRDTDGIERLWFNLPRREFMIAVAGYSAPLCAKIIEHWEQLE